MSRQIDLTKKLSKEDMAYLESRSDYAAIARNKAHLEGAEFVAEPTEPPAPAPAVQPNPDVPPADGDGEPSGTDYDVLTNEELQVILKSRDLAVSGNKAELIARLVENDPAK